MHKSDLIFLGEIVDALQSGDDISEETLKVFKNVYEKFKEIVAEYGEDKLKLDRYDVVCLANDPEKILVVAEPHDKLGYINAVEVGTGEELERKVYDLKDISALGGTIFTYDGGSLVKEFSEK